jgi:hypothetical protein
VADSFAVILQLLEIAEGFEDPWPRIFGATLVVLVLASILPAILRKVQGAAPEPAASRNGHAGQSDDFLAGAVIRVADRIELLNADPGNRSPEIRAEVARLRELAKSFQS